MNDTIYGGDAPLPLFYLHKWPPVVDSLRGLISNITKKDLAATNKSLLAFCKGEGFITTTTTTTTTTTITSTSAPTMIIIRPTNK